MIELLALDLAGHTGYAMMFGDGEIRVGSINLVRGNLTGKRNPLPMVRLFRRLEMLAKGFHVEAVIFEETFAQGIAKYRLDSLQHAVILWAMLNDIAWRRVSPPAWKKAMLGDGRATRTEYSKAAIKEFPETRFWNDDQCAARWILEYGLQ